MSIIWMKNTRPSATDTGHSPTLTVSASKPGDVVGFDLQLWHASCGGSKNRRMCTLVYYNNPKIPEEIAATRMQGQRNAQTMEKFGFPDDPIHPAPWIMNPDASRRRRRQRWIEFSGGGLSLDYPGVAQN